MRVRLQRVESGDLIVFPETAEGYVDKVLFQGFAGTTKPPMPVWPADCLNIVL